MWRPSGNRLDPPNISWLPVCSVDKHSAGGQQEAAGARASLDDATAAFVFIRAAQIPQ